MFDELNHLNEERLLALEKIIRQKEQVAKFYDKKVRVKTFEVGDLVWKVILLMDKKLKSFSKWSSNWEGLFEVERVFSNNAYSIHKIEGNNQILSINGKYLKKYKPTIHEIKINYIDYGSNCLITTKKEENYNIKKAETP